MRLLSVSSLRLRGEMSSMGAIFAAAISELIKQLEQCQRTAVRDSFALVRVVTSPKSPNGSVHGFEVALQLQVSRLESGSRMHVRPLGEFSFVVGCR